MKLLAVIPIPIVMHEGYSDFDGVTFALTLIIFGALLLIVTYVLALAKAKINQRNMRSEIDDSFLLTFTEIAGWASIGMVGLVFILAAILAGVTCLIR